jgi:hypothetical protein
MLMTGSGLKQELEDLLLVKLLLFCLTKVIEVVYTLAVRHPDASG